MEFDEADITYLDSLENEAEAKAYIEFLESEYRRHLKDVREIEARIRLVKQKFGWRE